MEAPFSVAKELIAVVSDIFVKKKRKKQEKGKANG
jgi:hypothetical protein